MVTTTWSLHSQRVQCKWCISLFLIGVRGQQGDLAFFLAGLAGHETSERRCGHPARILVVESHNQVPRVDQPQHGRSAFERVHRGSVLGRVDNNSNRSSGSKDVVQTSLGCNWVSSGALHGLLSCLV